MTRALSIIYMGTPDFAVPPLMTLAQSHHRLLLAVTRPDRPKGRGCKICCTQVKEAAQLHGLPVAQPPRVNDRAFVEQIRTLAPDIIVVAAFGQILPPEVLEIPRLGAVNIHASLLPKYRGAAPIQHAILNREPVTGITTIQMDSGLDSGGILMVRQVAIAPRETAGSLHDRLSILGADLLMETLEGVAAGTLRPIPQDHRHATYAPMLKKKDGKINWQRPAIELEAFVRGMNPWPGAFTRFGGKRLLIFQARALEGSYQAPPGSVVQGFDDELRIAAGQGALAIEELQQASGRRMSAADYLRGCCIAPGTLFS